MNLLIKYYDVIADLPTGGGIPDEVLVAAKQHAESFLGLGEWNKNWDKAFTACYSCAYQGFIAGYKNILEKMKEKDEEISRLKIDNERLRGEGWVSVEDRLPEGFWSDSEQEYYKRFSEQNNILSSNGKVGTAAYDRDKKDWFTSSLMSPVYFGSSRCVVTHWQPLPEPPSPTKK